jgi:hypothetical protein
LAGAFGLNNNGNTERKTGRMKKIKFAWVGISILYAALAGSATSYAGMMGGMHHGSNGHHGGYDDHHGDGYDDHHGDGAVHGGGYDDHHSGYADDPEPGWGRGGDNRPRDEHFGDTGAGHSHGSDSAPAPPADSGLPRQGP